MPKNTPPKPIFDEDWGRFLNERHRLILAWMDEGKPIAEIRRTLSMDDTQVLLISMTGLESTAPHQHGIGRDIEALARRVHAANKKWWHDPATGEPITRNVGELLMLVTSELAEALEGDRKSLPDDKLPHRRMFDVEIIDALIRLFDIVGGIVPDAAAIFEEKMAYNAQREDHKPENRVKPGGKKY